ncbi:MAG: hypothetical protein HY331_07605 [Chloroflexi bacterium]|nr:hypothetical protein [Chloroflexota bacterium]
MSTSCPAAEELRGYYVAFAARLADDDLPTAQRAVAAHAFACPRCYERLLSWLREDAAAAVGCSR